MAKKWILNTATSRYGLNRKSRVGPVSEWVRECAPRSLAEWQQYSFEKLSDFLKNKQIEITPEEYLKELGRKLYIKISEVIQAEIEDITLEDCIKFIHNLVIDKTFEGYKTEIHTIYGELEQELGVEIHPAPDEWDRRYNVDFFIQIGSKAIGIQIKPISFEQTPEFVNGKIGLRIPTADLKKNREGKFLRYFQ